MNEEKERLTLNMSRLDHYYESINNKSNVYIAVNTFLTGGLLAISTTTSILTNISTGYKLSLFGCMLLGLISLVILVYNSIPFLSKDKDSLYYFGAIANYSQESYCKKSKKYNSKQDLSDLRKQVHQLSSGLNIKFKRLEITGALLIFQFILLTPTIIFLILNP